MKNDIMKKSLTHRNFEGAKRQATLEEPIYSNYMPPLPKYQKCDPLKPSAGLYN